MVPQSTDLREEIIREFHCSRFAVHPGCTKMYLDLRCQYYWSGMKRHVGDFVRRCLTCHARPDPGQTRLADPNRSPGRDAIYTISIYCTETLIDLFFLRAVPVPVGI